MSLPSPSNQTSTTDHLSHLATAFRDPTTRSTYIAHTPEFAGWLDQVIKQTLLPALNDPTAGLSRLQEEDKRELVEVMRVVVNFVADNDDNRSIIHAQTSVLELLDSLLTRLTTTTAHTSPPDVDLDLDLNLIKPLLGAILNLSLTTTTHHPAREYWAENARWVGIVVLANALYIPCQGGREGEETTELKAVLASWAWKIVSSVSETETLTKPETLSSLPPDTFKHLTAPLQNFTHCHSHPTHQQQQQQPAPPPPSPDPSTMSQDLDILINCTAVVHLLSTTPVGCGMIARAVYTAGRKIQDTMDSGRVAERMVAFVEDGDVVDGWMDEEDEEEEEEEEKGGKEGDVAAHNGKTEPAAKQTDRPPFLQPSDEATTSSTTTSSKLKPGEKQLGVAKSSIMAALAEVCADFEFFDDQREGDGQWFWQILVRWMGVGVVDDDDQAHETSGETGRDDLVSCALLCIGNYIRNDPTANNIASHRLVITRVIHLLDSATPETPAQITHSLIGLLRNLALAPQQPDLKEQLVGPVLGACARIRVFQRERDMLGSVQGGAVVLLRLLCRNNSTTASTIAANSEILDQILALQQRADDQAIKVEISRLMTTLLTSLAKAEEITSPDQQTQGYTEAMVRDSRVLVCPATLVELGGQHEMLLAEGILALALVARGNANAVMNVLRASSTTLSALQKYVASPTAAQPVISNICILFLHLSSGIAGSSETDTVDSGRKSEEIDVGERIVKCLSTISKREGMDENIKMVVQAAQGVWKDAKV